MGIGQYRHRVTFDHPSGALVPPDWYCSVQSAASQVVDGLTAYFVRGRFHPGITLETQIIFEGRTFQVQSVTDVDERHVDLQLLCVEVVGRLGRDLTASVGTPPAITTPPQGTSVWPGDSVMLAVVAAGTAPLAYQWTKAGVDIVGATSAIYVTGPVTATTSYAVRVSNVYGSVTSSPATVTVLTYQDRVLADGARNYWPLDDPAGSTTARDLAGPQPGTISGGVTLQQPGVGGAMAMTFNGTTGKIVTTTQLAFPLEFTIECWLQQTVGAPSLLRPMMSMRGLTGTGTRVLVCLQTSDQPYAYTSAGPGAALGPVLARGTWQHLVYLFTGTTASLYVNGQSATLGAALTTTVANSLGAIGHDANSAVFWAGALQDIAIYPRALTPAEIAAHYALRVP